MTTSSTPSSLKLTVAKLFTKGGFKPFVRNYGTLLSTLLVCVIFSILSRYFLSVTNIMNILRQGAIITIISLGLTVVIAGGNFDISVCSIAGLANVLTAFMMRGGISFGIAAPVAIGMGAILGSINGFMVAKLRINTFLATVAMMFVADGFDILLSGGVRLMVPPKMLDFTRQIGVGSLGPIPNLLIILLVICIITYIILNRTRYGRYIYAVGGNPRCAYISGIPLSQYAWLTFTISGILGAAGGVLLTTRLSSGVPLVDASILGSVINATFIGMTVIAIGTANIPGTLLGGILLAILGNGLELLNVPFYYQYLLWGVVVVICVSFSGSGLSEAVIVFQAKSRVVARGLLLFISTYATPLLMVLLAVVLGILRPTFLQFANLMDILRYATPVALMAIGLTFTVAGGGFDISIGSMTSLATVLLAYLLTKGQPLFVSIAVVLASGLLLGLINGLLCGRLGLNPFVGTLAVLLGAAGPQYIMSKGGTPISISRQPVLDFIGKGFVGPFPVLVLILVTVALIMMFVFNQTRLGTYISALGGNPKALYISGVNIKNIATIMYVISGLMCAVAGIMLTSRLSAGLTKVAEPYLLDAIAAVFLGSTFFSRGRPHVLGALAGAVFMGMISNGLTLLGVPYWGTYLFRGLMVYFAVALSGMRSR
jgi:inositol transport system permease protein